MRRSVTARPCLAGIRGSLLVAVVAGIAGLALYGATTGADAVASGRTVSNLKITAVADPGARAPLYPGGTGDVVVRIANPDPYPVTVTAIGLAGDSAYAAGYTTGALTTPQPGCAADTPSGVTWNVPTVSGESRHALDGALTVGAAGTVDDPLTVVFDHGAVMSADAPPACAGAFFSMPALTGVTASVTTAPATESPATDAWVPGAAPTP